MDDLKLMRFNLFEHENLGDIVLIRLRLFRFLLFVILALWNFDSLFGGFVDDNVVVAIFEFKKVLLKVHGDKLVILILNIDQLSYLSLIHI